MKIFEAKKIAIEKFNSSPILSVKNTPALDADLLMSYITELNRSQLILKRNEELSEEQENNFFYAVEKREKGFPVAYIIGHKEFFGLDFIVTPDVLIPKPDTEILVELAIKTIKENQQIKICDVCTGSGCVGLSIICNCEISPSNYELTMTDISASALDIAQKNAKRLLNSEQLSKIKFALGDLLSTVGDETFNIIVSNPPYIPNHIVDELLKDGRNEPRLALDGDDKNGTSSNGLSVIKRLVPEAYEHLKFGGVFLCETGEYNAYDAAEIFKSSGFSEVTIFNDLAGTPRVVYGQKDGHARFAR